MKERKRMKIIHDNIWGDIELSDLAITIIDTRHFQRLHYIKQTGFSYKVFPNAMTTRFEHSIGVYHVVKLFIQTILQNQPEMRISQRKIELLGLAGLLHDIGHGPYSHNFDTLIDNWNSTLEWKDHEIRSCDIIRDLCNVYNIKLEEEEIQFIIDRILGINTNDWYDHLVNNKKTGIDCDKMDYLLRDSLNFGLQIKFDPHRIFRNSRVIDNELCFCERIQDEIMTCFLIRNKMNKNIYRHSKILNIESLYIQQMNLHLKMKDKILKMCQEKDIPSFIQMNDYNIIQELEKWNEIECRELKTNMNVTFPFVDKEWIKMTKIQWYNKKNINESFPLKDWKIMSCFS
jgi:HD superfamily phosphohydrolase